MTNIDVPMASIHFEQAGTEGPLVTFVHGGFCDGTDWRFQMDQLSQSCRVLAIDLRGHGKSPTSSFDSCTVENFARDVVAVVQSLGPEPSVLVGHSLGCRVISEAAHQSPEAVAGLIMVDGSRMGTGNGGRDAQAVLRRVDEIGTRAFFDNMFTEMWVGRVDPEIRASVMERLESVPDELLGAVVESTIMWDAERVEQVLDDVVAPVMAIQSSIAIPPAPRRSMTTLGESTPWLDVLAQRVPSLDVRVVTGVGHFCMLEAPDEVNAAILEFALVCGSPKSLTES